MFRFPATGPDFEEQIFGPQSVRSFGAVPDAAVRLRTAAYCRDKGLNPLSPDGSHMALCQDADYLHDLRYGPGINVIRCGMAPFPTVPLADGSSPRTKPCGSFSSGRPATTSDRNIPCKDLPFMMSHLWRPEYVPPCTEHAKNRAKE